MFPAGILYVLTASSSKSKYSLTRAGFRDAAQHFSNVEDHLTFRSGWQVLKHLTHNSPTAWPAMSATWSVMIVAVMGIPWQPMTLIHSTGISSHAAVTRSSCAWPSLWVGVPFHWSVRVLQGTLNCIATLWMERLGFPLGLMPEARSAVSACSIHCAGARSMKSVIVEFESCDRATWPSVMHEFSNLDDMPMRWLLLKLVICFDIIYYSNVTTWKHHVFLLEFMSNGQYAHWSHLLAYMLSYAALLLCNNFLSQT